MAHRRDEPDYKLVYDYALDGFLNGRVLYKNNVPSDVLLIRSNHVFEEYTGLKNISGKKASDVLQKNLALILKYLEEFKNTRVPYTENKKEVFIPKTGKWLSFTVKFLDNDGFIGMFDDITKIKSSQLQLNESVNLLVSITESIDDGIVVFDKNKNAIKFNKAFREMLELQDPDIQNLNLQKVFERISEKVLNADQIGAEYKNIQSDSFKSSAITLYFKDGRVYNRVTKPWIVNDEALGRVVSFRNITEIAQIQQELQKSIENLKFHIDNIPLAVIETDNMFRITGWSPGASEIFGWTAEEVTGKRYDDLKFVYHGDADRVKRIYSTVLSKNTKTLDIIRIYGKDGSIIWCEWNTSARFDKDGNLISILSIGADISKRIAAEEDIKKAQQFSQDIIGGVQEGIIVHDTNLTIIDWNPTMEKLWGKTRAEVIGTNSTYLFPKMNIHEINHNLKRALKGETNISIVHHLKAKYEDLPEWTSIKTLPQRNSSGEIIGVLAFVLDITEIKKNEIKLQLQVEQLTGLNRKLEEYAYAIQELNQFAYLSSHQLQAPVRTITNFINVFKEDYNEFLDEKADHYLDTIKESANKMASLIDALGDYARIGRKSRLGKFDIKKIIDNVLSDLAYIIITSGAKIDVSDMPVITGYATEFRLLIQNLLTNAIKFQRNGNKPMIKIASERAENKWIFSIEDNGIGIPPAHAHKVFEIFQRLHVHEDEYEGKGIGLAYCKKIVALHKGEIWFESIEKEGTKFHFSIPDQI